MLLGFHARRFELLRDTGIGVTGDAVLGLGRDPGTALAAGQPPRLPLTPLTTLIGRNNTGKSAMLHAMSFVADVVRHGVRDASVRNGRGGFARLRSEGDEGPMVFSLAVRLPDGAGIALYRLQLDCDASGRPHVQEEQLDLCPEHAAREDQIRRVFFVQNGRGTIMQDAQEQAAGVAREDMTALQAYGSIVAYPEAHALNRILTRWFFSRFTVPGEGDTETTPGGHRHIRPRGDNIANVIRYLRKEKPEAWLSILERIRDRMPDHDRVEEGALEGRLSDSSRRLFTYLLLLSDPSPRPLVALEHPDEGLHLDMVQTLAGELRDFTVRHDDAQILLTTHNPNILETLTPEEVWVFERSTDAETGRERTVTRCPGADPVVRSLYREGVGMGSMWYSGHFDAELHHAP